MVYLTNCYENNNHVDKRNGKLFFIENCSSCHSKTYRGAGNVPSILDLTSLDSSTLAVKLKAIQDNSSGHIHFDSAKYSPEVRDSVFNYIRNFLEPRY